MIMISLNLIRGYTVVFLWSSVNTKNWVWVSMVMSTFSSAVVTREPWESWHCCPLPVRPVN